MGESSDGGISEKQFARGSANGQRWAKRQPGGGSIGFGGSPFRQKKSELMKRIHAHLPQKKMNRQPIKAWEAMEAPFINPIQSAPLTIYFPLPFSPDFFWLPVSPININ